jgi:hypothetical protein
LNVIPICTATFGRKLVPNLKASQLIKSFLAEKLEPTHSKWWHALLLNLLKSNMREGAESYCWGELSTVDTVAQDLLPVCQSMSWLIAHVKTSSLSISLRFCLALGRADLVGTQQPQHRPLACGGSLVADTMPESGMLTRWLIKPREKSKLGCACSESETETSGDLPASSPGLHSCGFDRFPGSGLQHQPLSSKMSLLF